MFFLQTDLIAADSVATAKVTQTVEQIKSMPFEDALEFVTKGLLDFGWDILIAVAIYIVGRWIVRYLDRLLERIFTRREMEVSLAKFVRSFVRTALYVIIIITIVRKLGIEGGQVKVAKKRTIKGRAIWYDQMKAQILSAEEIAAREQEAETDAGN